jgi:hypothetical protein
MGDWNETNNNGFNFRDVYPTSPGSTVGQNATGGTSAAPGGAVMPTSNDAVSKAAAIGGQANPVVAGIVFMALVFGLMFLAKRLGTDDDFKSLKPSVYNVVTIALAATAGMPVLKFLATKFPVPGLSTWILAA